ncbi:MAG: 3-deoxy-7-phosphoheptulonate synthase [Candidatus Riflebacteria bacterium]|nr:3-deoxy-7-phosphoheptulonate synthase [Candidatus Riflebacteria bacterium]
MNKEWSKSSWRRLKVLQQPKWPDKIVCENVFDKLSNLPALVFAGETRSLVDLLAEVSEGKAFLLQAGECSEEFSRCHGPYIHDLLKVILQMAIIIAYAGGKKVVKVGRIAGQYAKPRSKDTETIDGRSIPSYRGDMVNSAEATSEARVPDPTRILDGYFRSAATLNLVRAFTRGGYAALNQIHSWRLECFPMRKYDELIKEIRKAINFTSALGLDLNIPQINEAVVYTSHEALLLEYEEALTRIDTTTGLWYDTSAHMLWLGDRTRQADGAHTEFLRGVRNPLGVKIGPKYEIDELKLLFEKLNSENTPGRVTLVTRFGHDKIEKFLPKLIREFKKEGFKVAWCCDPMHGNTYTNKNGLKTRVFEDILNEVRAFWSIHKAEGSIAGGVHLELTGESVTECTGGSSQILDMDLGKNYQSKCDPRLNAEQAVELAFELADIIKPCI